MTSIDQILQAAWEHHKAGRLPQAEANYQKVLQVSPNHPDALRLLGLIALHEGKNNIAVELIGKAIAANPSDPSNYGNLGNALQAQNKLDEAIESYHRALSINPNFAEVYYNLGLALQAQGKLGKAIESYRRAVSLKPDYAKAHYNLGLALQEQGKLEAAIESYRRAISFKPNFAEAYYNLGVVLQAQDYLDAAVESYRRAISLKPDYAKAHYNLGLALHVQGNPDAAIESYQRAISFKPDFTEAYTNLGTLLKEKGKLDDAVVIYRRAIALKPDCSEVHNNLGVVFLEQGQLDKAADCYRQALLFKPDYTEAYINLGSFLIDTGKLPEARTLAGHGLERVLDESWHIASFALVACWIDGLYAEAEALVKRYLDTVLSYSTHSKHRVFFMYVVELMQHKEARTDMYAIEAESPIIILGDSHSLSPANTSFDWMGVRVKAFSRFVYGVKMFHLASTVKKQYSIHLSAHLKAINPASHLLFTIGEIDCRPDEGIWKVSRKGRVPISGIITSTVDGYLDWIATHVAGRDFASITIQGVPAPNYRLEEMNDLGDRQAFLDMISAVNNRLKTGANSRGWKFLDVYAATAGEDGLSNGKWHMDNYHLQPALYAEAYKWIK